ncbi:hypothetical protein M427DRAFT_63392, partial [Gonapodya prolifera JEL478]
MIKKLQLTCDAPSPCPRQGHTFTLVSGTSGVTGRGDGAQTHSSSAVLFGGRTDSRPGTSTRNLLDDVWLFSFERGAWTNLTAPASAEHEHETSRPPPTHNHATVWWRTSLIIFGGATRDGYSNDVWELCFDGLADDSETFNRPYWKFWQPSSDHATPSPRAGHTAVPHGDLMIIFGGSQSHPPYATDPPYLNDTWALDVSTRTWRQITTTGPIPPPRNWHSASIVLLAQPDGTDAFVMVVFGGYWWDPTTRTEHYLDDCWSLSLPPRRDAGSSDPASAPNSNSWEWRQLSSQSTDPTHTCTPQPRNRHSSIVIQPQPHPPTTLPFYAIAIHGGNVLVNGTDEFLSDTWIGSLQPDSRSVTWQPPSTVPTPELAPTISHHAVVGGALNPIRGEWVDAQVRGLGVSEERWKRAGAVLLGGEVGPRRRSGDLWVVVYGH